MSVLDADATLAGAVGIYRLTMVRQQPNGKRQITSGSLRLRRSGIDAFAPATSPLQGATDIDLRAVGAFAIGDPESKDPTAPGVLVLESRQGGEPRILLRLGSDANRSSGHLFDGGHTILDVREITPSGFAGQWRSAAERQSASGYFCARQSGGR